MLWVVCETLIDSFSRRHAHVFRNPTQGVRPHNQEDAEKAGGMGKPDNGPPLRRSARNVIGEMQA